MSQGTRHPDERAPTVEELEALDRAVFDAPYIIIDRDNRKVATATTADAAWTALQQHYTAVSVVGTARPGLEVIDIDPADTGAPAEAGTAVAEDIRDWLNGYGLPYVLRASGRPGGHHLIAVVPNQLVDELAAHVATTADHHDVAAELRVPRTLRLLTAPHRYGHPAPVLDCALTPTDVPTAAVGPRPTPKRPHRATGRSDTDGRQTPSERAYKQTCAAIRRGLTITQTWALLGECRVVDRGQLDFRKYMWFPAVTEIAAERGLDESEAWELARTACTVRARELGRPAWRSRYWLPAVERAADPARPRARRLTEQPAAEATATSPADAAEQAAQLERTRTAMHEAAADLIATFRPQRQKSIRAVIDALAVALTSRDGSIDVRTLAEQACVSKGVTMQVKADLTEHGVLAVADRYAGGAEDCHRYVLGPRAEQAFSETETTRWYTPTGTPPPPPAPRTYGRANPAKMRLHHVRERTRWKLRCTLEDATKDTGENWATSQHPAARAARSLWAQRARWEALSEEDQEQRREARRRFLGTLPHGERRTWFDWLNRREALVQTAQRARSGAATGADRAALAAAPVTVHLGMRDRSWFENRPSGDKPAQQLWLFRDAA